MPTELDLKDQLLVLKWCTHIIDIIAFIQKWQAMPNILICLDANDNPMTTMIMGWSILLKRWLSLFFIVSDSLTEAQWQPIIAEAKLLTSA